MADPKPIRSLRLFARFFGGAGGWDFEVEVRWLDDPDDGAGDGTVTEVYGPFTVHFREGESVRDFIFPLRNVPLCGTGRYEFRLMALDASRFGDDWEPLAVEYFEVTRT